MILNYLISDFTIKYLEIIKNSSDIETALYNFPKYLFAEKEVFLTIYKKTNKDKLIKMYKNKRHLEGPCGGSGKDRNRDHFPSTHLVANRAKAPEPIKAGVDAEKRLYKK